MKKYSFFRKYLRKNEKVRETVLSWSYGAQVEFLMQKNGKKSGDTVPLRITILYMHHKLIWKVVFHGRPTWKIGRKNNNFFASHTKNSCGGSRTMWCRSGSEFYGKYLKTKIAQICTVSLFLYLKIAYINFLIYLYLFYLI